MSSPNMNVISETEPQKDCLEGTSHKLQRFIIALNKINYQEALRDTYLCALTCLLAM